MTPLHNAVEKDWTEGVLKLMQHGASITSRNQYGQTPLHYAAARGRHMMLEELLKSGTQKWQGNGVYKMQGASGVQTLQDDFLRSGSQKLFKEARKSYGNTKIPEEVLLNRTMNLVDAQDLRGVTPLHDAATVGSLKSVKVLLEHGSDPTVTDSNGQTALHKATKAGSLDCAAALMKCGADLLQKDDRGVTPKRYLRENPEHMETLLDMAIITSPNRQSGFPLTFDFSLLVAPYKMQQCKLLENFANTDCNYLLAHPVCHILLLVKWRKTRIIFMAYLLFFTLFSALSYTLMFDRFVWSKCTKKNQTLTDNDTVIWAGVSTAQPTTVPPDDRKETCEVKDDVFAVKVIMIVQILVFTAGQVNRFRSQPLGCLKSPTWWLLLSIIILCPVIILQSWLSPLERQWWEHHVATLIIMLQGTQILYLLSKFPSFGIYWLMFIRVAEMFLRVFFIYLCLLLTFTMTFYLALNDDDETNIFGNFGLTFLKSLTMMVGELDLSDMKDSLEQLPVTSHILLVMFILLISIILANLLVALAVSDINGLRSIAHLMRLAR